MEELFLLAEKITGVLKSKLSLDKEQIGVFNFEKALISNSSFEIYFSSIDFSIKVNLTTHHLEMPWAVQVFINSKNLNSLVDKLNNEDVVYEAYPNLLRDPNGLGFRMAEEIGNDILNYFKKLNI